MRKIAVLGASLLSISWLVAPSLWASPSPGIRKKYSTPAIEVEAIASAKQADQPKEPDKDDDYYWGRSYGGTGHASADANQAHTLSGLTMTARDSHIFGSLTSLSARDLGNGSIRPVTRFSVNHFGFADAAGPEIAEALKGQTINKAVADGELGGPLAFNRIRHEVGRPTLADSLEVPPGEGVIIAPPWSNTFGWTLTKPDGSTITVTGTVTEENVSGTIDGVPYNVNFEPNPVNGELRAILPYVYVPNYTKFDFSSTANMTIWAHKPRTASMAYRHRVSVSSSSTDGSSTGGPPVGPNP